MLVIVTNNTKTYTMPLNCVLKMVKWCLCIFITTEKKYRCCPAPFSPKKLVHERMLWYDSVFVRASNAAVKHHDQKAS